MPRMNNRNKNRNPNHRLRVSTAPNHDHIARGGGMERVAVPRWLQKLETLYGRGRVSAEEEGILQEWEASALIYRAFRFALELHEGQYRKSGAPYIIHPIAVASLIKELGGDPQMVAAGFLHDVVEDTDVTSKEIGERFGAEVRKLVEGVTNLSKVDFCNREDFQAENFRKMFNSMAQDIRVIVIKLTDRLHNMRTLQHLSREKQKRIATETLDIYAPLASRLGMWRVKCYLEDLSFKYLEPKMYKKLKGELGREGIGRRDLVRQAKQQIREKLEANDIEVVDVLSRYKHLYSLYGSIEAEEYKKQIEQINDVATVRVVVGSRMECYRALAVVHELFTPIPGRLKDIIALPKPNGYQSIHTEVIGRDGKPLGVQIRSREMHEIAEFGIAAEWKFRDRKGGVESDQVRWIRQVLDWQKELKDSPEFYQCLKENLFEDEVFAFTPRGDVITLKKASTPVDFAYRIHTEVGNHICECIINGKTCPLDTHLQDGDIIQVITNDEATPSLQWLNFAKTPAARNGIRRWFQRSRREENIYRGKQLLIEELGVNMRRMLESRMGRLVSDRLDFEDVGSMLAALGSGEMIVPAVIEAYQTVSLERSGIRSTCDTTSDTSSDTSSSHTDGVQRRNGPTTITHCHLAGLEGVRHAFPWCCRPLPGEPIVGLISRSEEWGGGGGVEVHHQSCKHIQDVDANDIVPLRWDGNQEPTNVDIMVDMIDRVGIMRDIMSLFSEDAISLTTAVCIGHKGTNTASARLSVGVTDVIQLNRIIDRIRTLADVYDVRRIVSE